MKLSELKVGMTITRDEWDVKSEILCVGKSTVFVRHENGIESCYQRADGWIEVKPKQKPSERILEIHHLKHSHFSPDISHAILDYLDETAESSK